jgi:hypothetical protein
MDLNYLYQRHQISLHKSEHAVCECSRAVHRSLANGYASQIALAKHFHSIPR